MLIRTGEDDGRVKLELAIIENLQREDLNPVDRARSFERMAKEFGLKQAEIGVKVGKSREYVSNSMRILMLPEIMIVALENGQISEGHTRPLLMLASRPDEQLVLFKEIMAKKLTVREAESLSRRVAVEKIRNKEKYLDPAIIEMERTFTESLGTRVRIEKGKEGGTVTIDFFSPDDLRAMLERLMNVQQALKSAAPVETSPISAPQLDNVALEAVVAETSHPIEAGMASVGGVDDRPAEEIKKDENEDIYSLKNFAI